MADGIYNGPHDNIWDNHNWNLYERDIYIIVDLVTLSPYISAFNDTLIPFLNLSEIKQLPIVIDKVKGLMGFINLETGSIINNFPDVLTKELVKIEMLSILAGFS